MSLKWIYGLSPDGFQCKERGCEDYNDKIYAGFKHMPSTLNNLGRGVISELAVLKYQNFFISIVFNNLSFFSSIAICIYVVDDNFIFFIY